MIHVKEPNAIQKHMSSLQTKVVYKPAFYVDAKTKIVKSPDIHKCEDCKKYHEWRTKRACKKSCSIEDTCKAINPDLHVSSIMKLRNMHIREQALRG